MNKFLLAVFAAIILTACKNEEPSVTEPNPPLKSPRVNLQGPSQTNPGVWLRFSWQGLDVDSCFAPWTTIRSVTGQDSVKVMTNSWIIISCSGTSGTVQDSIYVQVIVPPAPRRLIVVVDYVTPEGVTYTPTTVPLTFENEGVTTVIPVLDTTSIEAPLPYGDTVSFSIPGNSHYFPVIARVPKENFSIDASPADTISIVRIPRVWTIERGVFAGQRINISLKAAYDTAPDGSSLFGRGKKELSDSLGGYWYGQYGWNKNTFPVKLSLNHSQIPSAPMTSQDSIDLWRNARLMEQKYGRSLFYPGPASINPFDPGIQVWIDPLAQKPYGGGVGKTGSDGISELYGGIFATTVSERFSNSFVFEHEILHTFGYGHNCSWASVLVSSCPRGDEPVVYPAPEKDIAYFELWSTVDNVRRRHKALYHWGENLNGEKKERNLSLDLIRYSRFGNSQR